MELFLRIMNTVESYDEYFVQKWSAANIAGLSCFQKVTAAFRMQKWSAANVARLSCFQKVTTAFHKPCSLGLILCTSLLRQISINEYKYLSI